VEGLVSLLPLVGIALLFWILIIRPAQRRQKELGRMQSSLDVGDEVMLTSGVFGTVHSLADDHAMVEVAAGVQLKVARGAIGSVVPTAKADEPADRPTDGPGEAEAAEEN
jgi:preprotein translocase subunit YajC